MSVDKTIEELSYTLAQLGTLVSHINAQVVGITSRINTTLETFDSSVAGIAVDASALTHQVAFTVAQVPNAWVFYLLFITLIVVFILLSFVLTINIIAKCHGIYRLVKAPRSISSSWSL
uniref:Plasma membrane fusion protein PRM1 n=1 Tax=Parascaris univalens TaxID=6257 RepID=A0A914ZP08_PARUN